MSDRLTVTIERDECIMCGACRATCPEFFEESLDDDLSQVVARYRAGDEPGVGQVPEDLESCVREAAEGCPAGVIHVE